MKRVLAISDIHGELELFDSLLEKLNYDADEDQLILLGDYVDRGRDSKGVLNRVSEDNELENANRFFTSDLFGNRLEFIE